jgi:hypothetical protein
MYFEEIDAGGYRIYAGALERGRSRSFSAAVVVMRLHADGRREEVFREEDLGGGYAWASAQDALRHAVQCGRDVVMCRTGVRSRAAA